MLKEIYCDEFIENGEVRSPIKFTNGLNVILGGDQGTNSIGKSTFLMILDFIFGGSDYVKKEVDVQKQVGIHTIKFQFEFASKNYYFSRSTGKFDTVIVCDENYHPLEDGELSIKDYCQFLADQYQITTMSFRNAVSRFIRVYGRATVDEVHPLQNVAQEANKQQIFNLLMLFEKYEPVKDREEATKQAADKYKAFQGVKKYDFVPIARTKQMVKDNEAEIQELQDKILQLKNSTNQELPTLDEMEAAQLRQLSNELNINLAKRNLDSKRLELIQENRDTSQRRFQSNYRELREFFPEVNLQKVEMVENFHRQIFKLLEKEFTAAEKNIRGDLAAEKEKIGELKNEITAIKGSDSTNVTNEILDEYSRLKLQLDKLEKENARFKENEELKKNKSDQAEALQAITKTQTELVQKALNDEMASLNELVCGSKKYQAPVIEIDGSKKYVFETPDDHGTGTSFKGLILFDEACLKLTKLPFIIHDSLLFSDIEEQRVENIINMYVRENKQIFIALDRIARYNEKIQEEISSHTVLHLERGGKELFGRSWNEKDDK